VEYPSQSCFELLPLLFTLSPFGTTGFLTVCVLDAGTDGLIIIIYFKSRAVSGLRTRAEPINASTADSREQAFL